MTTDSRVLLPANFGYMRGLRGEQGSSLQKASWGDFNKDGQVNILDGSNMAFFFDKTNSYWAHPQYACTSTTTIVDVCVASGIAVLFDTGNTAPFGGTGLTCPPLDNLDCGIDVWNIPLPVVIQLGDCIYTQITFPGFTSIINLQCNTTHIIPPPTNFTTSCTANLVQIDGTEGFTRNSVPGSGLNCNWNPPLTPGRWHIRVYGNGQILTRDYYVDIT